MDRYSSTLLRAVLLLLAAGSVIGQLLLPKAAWDETAMYPELAYLAVPYSLAGILFIACGQVALWAVWRLLDLVDKSVIFTGPALRWVDVIRACGLAATVLGATPPFHLLFVVGVGGPGVLLGLAACVAGGLAFVLLVSVMRGLLESAIADHSEVDGLV